MLSYKTLDLFMSFNIDRCHQSSYNYKYMAVFNERKKKKEVMS